MSNIYLIGHILHMNACDLEKSVYWVTVVVT